MKKYIYQIIAIIAPLLMFASCTDLDIYPENTSSSEVVFSTFEGTKGALAKVYLAYTTTGNTSPAGKSDLPIPGIDEGQNADFLRVWFNHQELPTEEAHCLWIQDPGIPELNDINFTIDDRFTSGLYYRVVMQIMYANEFIRNAKEDLGAEVTNFKAEARFIRAFDYWVLLDIFGNPPFVTENDALGILPAQTNRIELFKYVESELLDITNNNLLKAPKANEYGRADQAAAWALLARLYLNAEVYTGTARWTDAATYAKKVIDAGFSLKGNYEELFLADNDKNNPEIILAIAYDGQKAYGYGGTSFLVNCGSNIDYQSTYADKIISYGMLGNNKYWNGYRIRKEMFSKFGQNDKRFLFVGENSAIDNSPTNWEYGLQTYKYRNITSASTVGNPVYGSGANQDAADIDFPLFRLAEQYLIYAEAVVRGGSGSKGDAVGYINQLRTRADVSSIGESQLTANFILDERARELYWECFRRTDLIRYGLFTSSSYVWEWKGGVKDGRGADAHFNIYPLPASDINANTNLKQNQGY
ncbi:membrane protein [Bacteroidia bacterium]|nr:membrane protein [Bacteroidia bacterium]